MIDRIVEIVNRGWNTEIFCIWHAKQGFIEVTQKAWTPNQWRRIKENDREREGTGLAITHQPREMCSHLSYKRTNKNIGKNAFIRHISWLLIPDSSQKNKIMWNKFIKQWRNQKKEKVGFLSLFSITVRRQLTDENYMLSHYREPTNIQSYCRKSKHRRNEPFLYSQPHPLWSMINQKNMLS